MIRFVVSLAVTLSVNSIVLMLLWNVVCPSLFGLNQITLFQSYGFVFICNILVGKGISFDFTLPEGEEE